MTSLLVLLKNKLIKIKSVDIAEWLCCVTAMIASLLVASNTNPGMGYVFYLISTILGIYLFLVLKRWGMLTLQFYFIIINSIGILTWMKI